MARLPPALAATATPRILELLGDPPATVLELGFGGIHTEHLRLAGFDVVVVAPDGTDLTGIRAARRIIVKADGSVLG